MATIRSVCVYCGSQDGRDASHAAAARAMGDALVDRGMRLVFGGGHVGMMGQIADRVLARGGEAFGVIPKALMRAEVAHEGLTELRVTEDMHERKALMAEWSDAFVTLPGGLGKGAQGDFRRFLFHHAAHGEHLDEPQGTQAGPLEVWLDALFLRYVGEVGTASSAHHRHMAFFPSMALMDRKARLTPSLSVRVTSSNDL